MPRRGRSTTVAGGTHLLAYLVLRRTMILEVARYTINADILPLITKVFSGLLAQYSLALRACDGP